MSDDRLVWQALVNSEGWQRFVTHFQREWSDRNVLSSIASHITKQKPGDFQATHDIVTKFLEARSVVELMLDYPYRQIAALDAHDHAVEALPIVPRRA